MRRRAQYQKNPAFSELYDNRRTVLIEVCQVSSLVHKHLLLGVEGTVRAACRGRRGPLGPGVGTVLRRPWDRFKTTLRAFLFGFSHPLSYPGFVKISSLYKL